MTDAWGTVRMQAEIEKLMKRVQTLHGFTSEDVEALVYRGVGYDEGHDQEKLDHISDLIEDLL